MSETERRIVLLVAVIRIAALIAIVSIAAISSDWWLMSAVGVFAITELIIAWDSTRDEE